MLINKFAIKIIVVFMRLTLLIYLVCLNTCSYSQNLFADIKKNWYAAVPYMNPDMLDTIRLYPEKPYSAGRPVIAWEYKTDNTYQLVVYDHSDPSLPDPVYYSPEKWVIKVKADGKHLIMKDTKRQKLFHSNIRYYRLIENRDDHLLLRSIVLIRE